MRKLISSKLPHQGIFGDEPLIDRLNGNVAMVEFHHDIFTALNSLEHRLIDMPEDIQSDIQQWATAIKSVSDEMSKAIKFEIERSNEETKS